MAVSDSSALQSKLLDVVTSSELESADSAVFCAAEVVAGAEVAAAWYPGRKLGE